MMCHECKYMPLAEKRAILASEASEREISCCFYSFRKLKSSKFGGSVNVVGFLDPQRDPTDSTLLVWQKSLSLPDFANVEKAKFILGLIGDQFCDMVIAERKCLSMHYEIAENKASVWKPAVKGVREMCDVCKTTIFNYHWICGRCGVFICLDCYQVIFPIQASNLFVSTAGCTKSASTIAGFAEWLIIHLFYRTVLYFIELKDQALTNCGTFELTREIPFESCGGNIY